MQTLVEPTDSPRRWPSAKTAMCPLPNWQRRAVRTPARAARAPRESRKKP